ncbi:YfiR family protein [Phenylobacterium sp.]|jgi:hypothetical protein|uniref:YfiR family protein n=1 Tax=Phenylobacterium sp. TaxID=1871053 RepID=UPI003784D4C6
MIRRRPLLSVVTLAALAVAAAARAQPADYQVKAAFLLKFAPFVEWPAGAAPSGAPLVVCVVGQDPFGPTLTALSRASATGRPIVVRKLAAIDRGSGCQVAYLAGGIRQTPGEGLREVAGAPVLTVTDEAAPGSAQGVIHFMVRDRRVRFAIDQGAARRQGLALSSKLLSLALTVRP